MIEATLLVALGFLTASLIALIIAPAFWSRAVRLTTERIRASLPMTEAEIRAEKDQMRAKYAVRVHQLEKAIDDARLSAARQKIDLNRRDSKLIELGKEKTALGDELQENKNARKVLEETINERLPLLEQRLFEAGQMLNERDREINELSTMGEEIDLALREARTINEQQTQELDYLRRTLDVRKDQDRQRLSQFAVESDSALFGEVTLLRERNREQSRVIETLRQQANAALSAVTGQVAGQGTGMGQGGEAYGDLSQRHGLEQLEVLQQFAQRQAVQIEELTAQLSDALSSGEGAVAGSAALEAELRAVQAREATLQDNVERIRGERDALQAMLSRRDADLETGKVGNRHLLKIDGLEKQLQRERELSQRLRLELTATHERSAHQVVMFKDQLRQGPQSTRRNKASTRQMAEERLRGDLERIKTRSHELGLTGEPGAPEQGQQNDPGLNGLDRSHGGAPTPLHDSSSGRLGSRLADKLRKGRVERAPIGQGPEGSSDSTPAAPVDPRDPTQPVSLEQQHEHAQVVSLEQAQRGEAPADGEQAAEGDQGGTRSKFLERLRSYN
ncbi:MAG: hypothetical protein AAGF32_00800 [Pseudomonadota bacterium]